MERLNIKTTAEYFNTENDELSKLINEYGCTRENQLLNMCGYYVPNTYGSLESLKAGIDTYVYLGWNVVEILESTSGEYYLLLGD